MQIVLVVALIALCGYAIIKNIIGICRDVKKRKTKKEEINNDGN